MKQISFYLVSIIFFIVACSKKDSENETKPVGNFLLKINSIDVIDTGEVHISAEINSIQNVDNYIDYGFIIDDNAGNSDTIIVGKTKTIRSFSKEINTLRRNKNYNISAYAFEQMVGKRFSAIKNITTKAFKIDSIRPLDPLPQEIIKLYGKGFIDYDEVKSPIYLIKWDGSDSIRTHVISSDNKFLSLTYEDQERGVFFKDIPYELASLQFTHNSSNYYASTLTIYTLKPFISEINKTIFNRNDEIRVKGYFGNQGPPTKAFLNDRECSVVGWNVVFHRRYHQIQEVDLFAPQSIENGIYTLKIQVGEFSVEAAQKITIN